MAAMEESSVTGRLTPYQVAIEELGVSEVPGIAANKRIQEYHSTTRLAALSDEVPWCSAFVNWCCVQAGIRGTGSAAARSWLSWGVPCAPREGCVVVMARGNNAALGHVAFYVADFDSQRITVLGGNQGDCVSYGVYAKSRVLGYRWPAEA
jgi:uncharacterized protein (TIGR02594 family)